MSWKFTLNVAEIIVTAMNINQIVECSSPSPTTWEILVCLFRTWSFIWFTSDIHSTDNSNSVASLSMMKFWEFATSWEVISSVAPIYHEVILCTSRIAQFRREEFLRDQVEFFVPFSKCCQVAMIDRASWPQLSTLEKTKHGGNPILNNLLKRSSRINLFPCHVALIYLLQQLISMDLAVISLPRAHWIWRRHERWPPCNKIHQRFCFCCDWFFSWILLRSLRHCSWANCRTEMGVIEQAQQMIPLITCEISFSQNISELVLDVDVFDLDFGVQIDPINQPIKSNSVSPGNMSLCGTRSLHWHFDHWKLLDAKTRHLRERNQHSPSHWSSLEIFDVSKHHWQVLFYLKLERRFQRQKQWDPIVPEQATHPISVQCPERWFQILWNCEKLVFVSCTSNLLEQMYDFQNAQWMFVQKWISNLQDLPRSQSLLKQSHPALFGKLPTWQYC